MHRRFLDLGMQVKADVVASHLQCLQAQIDEGGSSVIFPERISSLPLDIFST
jgi:hypothetical protein